MNSNRLRIAWFSPLTPPSGVPESLGQYATEMLLPKLEQACDIEIFHDSLSTYQGRPVYPYLNAWRHHTERPFDLFFYQIEDDRRSYFSRIHSALVPGVTWFHHFFLSDFGPEPILNSPWAEVIERFNGVRSVWPDRDAKHEPQGPQAFRESSISAVNIFSNERDHREYRRTRRTAIQRTLDRSYYVPLPAEIPGFREAPNVDDFVIAMRASVRIEDRAHVLLEAVSHLPFPYRVLWCVSTSDLPVAQEMVAEFGVQNTVEVREGASPKVWEEVVSQASVAIHCTFSVFGQLGPYLGISAAHGVPCIVCNFGQGELFPDVLFFKISYGDASANELATVLKAIHDGAVNGVRRGLKVYSRELFDPDVVAAELRNVFVHAIPTLRELGTRWDRFSDAARNSLLAEVEALTERLAPEHGVFDTVFGELGWRRSEAHTVGKSGNEP